MTKVRAIKFSLAAVAIGALSLAGSCMLIDRTSEGKTYSDIRAIPHRSVGLLLGCSKFLGNGDVNVFFQHRVAAAAELYQAAKVDYLLVSGDNHVYSYDEATDMKNSLTELGVPEDRIYCDYAGFRTLDSVVRAREVFGQSQITVISQEFHNRRAIFIAHHYGMDAIGYNAPEVDAYDSFKTQCREQLAKAAAVVDVYLLGTQPRYLGPKIAIGPIPERKSI